MLFPESFGRCIFPPYLWNPLANGTDRVWVTQTHFYEKTDEWDNQMELTGKRHSITARVKVGARCDDYAGSVPCFKQHFKWEKTCLESHGDDNRYKVFHQGNG